MLLLLFICLFFPLGKARSLTNKQTICRWIRGLWVIFSKRKASPTHKFHWRYCWYVLPDLRWLLGIWLHWRGIQLFQYEIMAKKTCPHWYHYCLFIYIIFSRVKDRSLAKKAKGKSGHLRKLFTEERINDENFEIIQKSAKMEKFYTILNFQLRRQ